MQGETILIFKIMSSVGEFQSTPPMQGETDTFLCRENFCRISIHSPYAGGDTTCKCALPGSKHSNPLPLSGGDHWANSLNDKPPKFNSTPLIQGETITN